MRRSGRWSMPCCGAAGGVRIDHIIGLFRLWWIPEGAAPTEGTYVRYDHDALIGIVALEAMRAGAVVVGEDPGHRRTLGAGLPERARGLFGTSILWFERDREWGQPDKPLPADRWREACLSSVTTHDLPPTAGYLAGEHIRLREELGLLTRPAEEELAARPRRAGGLAGGAAAARARRHRPRYRRDHPRAVRLPGPDPVQAAGSALCPDAVGDVRAQNQPGTTDEYPNWRVPLAGPDGRRLRIEDIFSDPGQRVGRSNEIPGTDDGIVTGVSTGVVLRYVRTAPRHPEGT